MIGAHDGDDGARRPAAARALADLLRPLLDEDEPWQRQRQRGQDSARGPGDDGGPDQRQRDGDGGDVGDVGDILAAIRALVPTLQPGRSLFAAFHDGQVHHPLGGAAYTFEKDLVGPLLEALAGDEALPVASRAGNASARDTPPAVVVEISLVDTAPVAAETVELDGLQYQRSYRDVPAALEAHMADYVEVLRQMSAWSEIPFRLTFQADFFSHPSMPSLVSYAVENQARLGPQLSPKYHALAIRAACPVSGCALAEKHSRLNRYLADGIHFSCPCHGQHSVSLSDPDQVARLEANAPTRNLLRSMLHLVDETAHHVRITGADYAGTYQEALLYRPLAQWSAVTGLAVGRTPHILYAPLVVDWSGAKLSKRLYVRKGGYDAMESLGTAGLHSFARLKSKHGSEGLRRIWTEVEGWLAEPHKLFRASVSVEYLQGIIDGTQWQ